MGERTFEDEFADVQIGLVDLVLEACEGRGGIGDVYVFGAIEGTMTSFNAFVERGSELERLDAVVADRSILLQVMGLAAQDLAGLRELCERAGRACPTQIRGHWRNDGGSYEATCEYEPVADREDGVAPGTAFAAWLEDERAARRG